MNGEEIITRSLTASKIKDRYGNTWQYHSRSDRHSKISCWAIMFDLLKACPLLRDHAVSGKVAFGINHELRDFQQNRTKNLDLVLCTQRDEALMSFADYGISCGVRLESAELEQLAALPVLKRASVANVLMALEAKACMTEHVKALPRLYDELASSHQTVHGDTQGAIAAGYVMINCADTFISPDRHRQRVRKGKYIINQHRQPAVAQRALEAVMKLPRRSGSEAHGFDALGISMVRCANDGSPITLDSVANASVPDIARYGAFVNRLAHLYATKFSAL